MTLWWRDAWCPRCEAAPGEHCVSAKGRRTTTHADRHREGAYIQFYVDEGGYEDDEYDPNDYVTVERPSRSMITVHLPGDAP